MSRKSRLLRILLTLLALFLFVGYFTFSTFLFDPFESGLGVDVSGLVPREVNFFVARARLKTVFGDFPELAVMEDLEDNEAWRTWRASPARAELAASLEFDELMASIKREVSALPTGVAPLDLFGGDDCAVAGNFRGSSVADAEWALYGTLSTMGKLGVEALAYPGLLGLTEQGIEVAEMENYVLVTSPDLGAPLYVSRLRDVGILSNSPELIAKAHSLEATGFEGSFLASPTYNDRIQLANRGPERDEIELHINTRALMETMQVSGAWPDAKSQDLAPALASRFFQMGMVNSVVGILGLDEGISLDLHAQLSSELMTPLQTMNYRRHAVSGEELIDRFAIFAPEDASLFVYLKVDMGDLLTAITDSMEPTMRDLIEECFQATGKYRSLKEVIDVVDSALLDRCVLIMRPNDYAPDPDGPPHNDTEVPAVGLVTWLADGGDEKIQALRDLVGQRMNTCLGLQGKEPGASGFYSNSVGGHVIREYWQPQIDGTGVIATGNAFDICIIANSFQMIDHIYKTWTQGAPTHPRLSERPDFRALANSANQGANLAVWVDPRSALPFLRKSVRRWAEDSIEVDWVFERQRVEDAVLRDEFRGKKKADLIPTERADFEQMVDLRVNEIDSQIRAQQVPALMEKYERKLTYGAAVRSGLLMLAADAKHLDLTLRLVTPLDE